MVCCSLLVQPVMTFEEASMPEYILREVLKQGFQAPSPIQSQGWPMALLGRDMIGISATGSGKTLAFLLPAMIHINAQVFQKKYSLFMQQRLNFDPAKRRSGHGSIQ
jgi:superfamily II DNA/RNA helicase